MSSQEILSLFGLRESTSEDDEMSTISSQIIENIQITVRKSVEQNPDIIRVILHDAGFDGFDDTIIPAMLAPILELPSTTPRSSLRICTSPLPKTDLASISNIDESLPAKELLDTIEIQPVVKPTSWFCMCFIK